MCTCDVCAWSAQSPLTRANSLLSLTPLPGTSVIFPTRTGSGIPVTRFLISDPEAHIYRTLRLGVREPMTERCNLDTYVPGGDDLSAALRCCELLEFAQDGLHESEREVVRRAISRTLQAHSADMRSRGATRSTIVRKSSSGELLAASFRALHQRMHNALYCVVPRPVTGMSATAVWGRLHGASACLCFSARPSPRPVVAIRAPLLFVFPDWLPTIFLRVSRSTACYPPTSHPSTFGTAFKPTSRCWSERIFRS